jgi:hypothetical protein
MKIVGVVSAGHNNYCRPTDIMRFKAFLFGGREHRLDVENNQLRRSPIDGAIAAQGGHRNPRSGLMDVKVGEPILPRIQRPGRRMHAVPRRFARQRFDEEAECQ